MKQRRGIRRVIIRAGIFLLLVSGGAIVNIAVAWGVQWYWKDLALLDGFDKLRGTAIAHDWPHCTQWIVHRYEALGTARITSGWRTKSLTYIHSTLIDPQELFPASLDYLVPPDGQTDTDVRLRVADLSGWPQVSMWSGFEIVARDTTPRTVSEWFDIQRGVWLPVRSGPITLGPVIEMQAGIPMAAKKAPLAGTDQFRLVPFGVLWPGFALNTLFYAAILWLLLALPRALRRWRRVKRGLCPACAYPVGTSEVCTECGTPVARELSGFIWAIARDVKMIQATTGGRSGGPSTTL